MACNGRSQPDRSTARKGARFLAPFVALLMPMCAVSAALDSTDLLARLQHERVARLGAEGALRATDAEFIGQLLVEPASPYSSTVARPTFTNEVEWPIVLAELPGNVSEDDALAALYRDLGLSRARPDIDIAPAPGFRDAFLGANAAKASVDADIFWHTLDMAGYRHSARGATYAVAIQILRGQMAAIPRERWDSVGVDAGVFNRFMAARDLADMTAYDLEYLATLVQHRLIHREAGASGLRDLPVAFRIARVAAAYRDAQGYFTSPPCRADGSAAGQYAGTGAAGDDRPLCFVAATDRAVHRWYRDEVRREAAWVPPVEHSGLQRALGLVGAILALVDLAPLIEVMEAITADELATADVLTATEADIAAERADVLSCTIPGVDP